MESWQQEAFEAMGVTLLQPRFAFPAARAGHAVVTPVQEKPVTVKADSPSAPSPDTDTGPAFDVSRLAEGLSGSPAETKPVVEPGEAPGGARTALRFRLRLMRFGKLLMLVDQPMLQWPDEQAAKAFFADIHYFIFGAMADDFNDQVFTWPPAKQFPLADDINCARQTVAGFIREMTADCDKPWLLLWGPQVAECLVENRSGNGEVVLQDNYRLLQLEPLSHYWQSPASKHLLWQHLQVIKKQHEA